MKNFEEVEAARSRLVSGLVMLGIGLAIVIFMEFLVRTSGPMVVKIAFLGPTLLGVGAARLLGGKYTKLAWALGLLLGGAGLVAGAFYQISLGSGNPNMVSNALEQLEETVMNLTGLAHAPPTRAAVDAAVAEVTAKAADIAKKQQTTSPRDAQAVAALQKEISDYNTRQADVRKMYDEYMIRSKSDADLRSGIIGAWRQSDVSSTGAIKTITMNLKEDGAVHFDYVKDYSHAQRPPAPDFTRIKPGEAVDTGYNEGVSMKDDGTWTVRGGYLRVYRQQYDDDNFGQLGSMSLRILSISDTELRVEDDEGKVIVSKRIKMVE